MPKCWLSLVGQSKLCRCDDYQKHQACSTDSPAVCCTSADASGESCRACQASLPSAIVKRPILFSYRKVSQGNAAQSHVVCDTERCPQTPHMHSLTQEQLVMSSINILVKRSRGGGFHVSYPATLQLPWASSEVAAALASEHHGIANKANHTSCASNDSCWKRGVMLVSRETAQVWVADVRRLNLACAHCSTERGRCKTTTNMKMDGDD